MYDAGRISDIDVYKDGILAREAQTSTGLGDGIAMPHAKNSAVKKATVLFAKSKTGVDYESLDGQPTFLFFMIAAPEGANDTHLQALAALSRLLVDPDFVAKLKAAETPDQVQKTFDTAEKAKEAEEKQKLRRRQNKNQRYEPTLSRGRNSLSYRYCTHLHGRGRFEEKAKELGVDIKVETNGSEGIKHRLTDEDIARADGVIVAADKKLK